MENLLQIREADRRLLGGVDSALAEAARRGGEWVACRPGCTGCCLGPFTINQLDALRLREGLAELARRDPARAEHVRQRAAAYVAMLGPDHPGEFDEQADFPLAVEDVPCPALDPLTGWCDLFAARPMICRTFGPAARTGDNTLAACELCYSGATDEEIDGCAVRFDPRGLESALLLALDAAALRGNTLVALALL